MSVAWCEDMNILLANMHVRQFCHADMWPARLLHYDINCPLIIVTIFLHSSHSPNLGLPLRVHDPPIHILCLCNVWNLTPMLCS